MVDEGGNGGGKVVRWDTSSGKGDSGGRCCGVSWEGGVEVCVMGRNDGCLLSGGESVLGRIVLAFFLTRMVSQILCGFLCFLGFSLLGRVSLDLPPYPGIFLSECLHLISIALLQIRQLLLHFGLAFKDGGKVQGDVSRRCRTCFSLLHNTSSAASRNHRRESVG